MKRFYVPLYVAISVEFSQNTCFSASSGPDAEKGKDIVTPKTNPPLSFPWKRMGVTVHVRSPFRRSRHLTTVVEVMEKKGSTRSACVQDIRDEPGRGKERGRGQRCPILCTVVKERLTKLTILLNRSASLKETYGKVKWWT